MVGVARIELATPAMSTQCSTTELHAHPRPVEVSPRRDGRRHLVGACLWCKRRNARPAHKNSEPRLRTLAGQQQLAERPYHRLRAVRAPPLGSRRASGPASWSFRFGEQTASGAHPSQTKRRPERRPRPCCASCSAGSAAGPARPPEAHFPLLLRPSYPRPPPADIGDLGITHFAVVILIHRQWIGPCT